MTFHVNQKVVCVNADPRAFNPVSCDWKPGEAPVEGDIYTVTRVYVAADQLRLWLAELKRAPIAFDVYGGIAGYAAERFRPVVEPKTDISALTALLNPKHEMEPV
jgi:hypothetical protein